MRINIFFILILLTSNTQGQDKDIPYLNMIYRLRNEAQDASIEKSRYQKIASDIVQQLDIEKKKTIRNENRIDELYSRLGAAKENYYRLTTLYGKKNDSLKYAYQVIDTLNTQNKEIKKIVEEYRLEVKRLREINDTISVANFNSQNDAELLSIMLSQFTTYEVGYMHNRKFTVTKVYDEETLDSEDENIAFVNPEFFSDKLNRLKYKGTLCLPKRKSLGQNVNGEILIYANEKLVYRLKENLKQQIGNKLTNQICYTINSSPKVDFKFPPKARIRMAYIDEKKISEIVPDELSNFWEAEEKQLFLLSSTRQTFRLNNIAETVLLENSAIIDTIYCNSRTLTFDFYDSGGNDGDIASFYANGKLEVGRLLLKSIPESKTITLKAPETLFTLISNWEGDIPPCTAYIVVYENGNKIGSVYLGGTNYKTESVRIICKR